MEPRGLSARARTAVIIGAVVLTCAGMWLGLRAATPGEYDSALGRVAISVRPSLDGELNAYVPLADWGLRAQAFDAPLTVDFEPRTLDRTALLRAAGGDRTVLDATVDDLEDAAARTAWRTVRYATAGAAVAALVAFLALYAWGVRGRRVLFGVPVGMVVAALATSGVVLFMAHQTFDPGALERPTFYARGAELFQLLDAAADAQQVGDSYSAKVAGSLRGFASLLARPNAGAVSADVRRAIQISDVHNNRPALRSLGAYVDDQPVFFVGDLGQHGSAAESAALVPTLAGLSDRVVAVSGNHDSRLVTRALVERGVVVLTRRGQLLPDGSHGRQVVEVDGLRVAGFDDPLEYRGREPTDPRRIFSFGNLPDGEQAERRAQRDIVEWFRQLPERPDVVLVHQNTLAQHLARTIAGTDAGAGPDAAPLTILTGHDHKQHIDVHGATVVVDAGTAGASGLYGVGRDYVGLAELQFSPGNALDIVNLVQVEPVSGSAQAHRVPIDGCEQAPTPCAAPDNRLDDLAGGLPVGQTRGAAAGIGP